MTPVIIRIEGDGWDFEDIGYREGAMRVIGGVRLQDGHDPVLQRPACDRPAGGGL
jgi:hypothetical protein